MNFRANNAARYELFVIFVEKMTTSSIIILFLFSLLASSVQRVSGFGFGIIVMAMLPYLMPSYGEATALSGMLAIVTALVPALSHVRVVPWRKLLPILVSFLVVSFFAVKIVSRVEGGDLKHILGGVLILISLYFFLVGDRVHIRPTLPLQLGLGTLSGLMGGLFAMQGPPAVIYFMSSADGKDEYIALTQWYFLTGNLMMTLFRLRAGFVTPVVVESWALTIPAILIGLWIGSKVFERIRAELLRKIVYAFLALSGVVAIVL